MKTRILAIIPNENIGTLFIQAAKGIEDVEITVRHATLTEGATLASNLESEFDVVIARGETAKIISKKVHIPIIELEIAPNEILSSIKQAEAIGQPFAVVGFPPLTSRTQRLADLMATKLNIYTIFNRNDADIVFQKIYDAGFRVVVSGTGLNQYGHRYNITIISIVTTFSNIESVVSQAAMLGRIIVENRKMNSIMQTLLDGNAEKHIVFNSQRKIIFNNTNDDEFLVTTCKQLLSNKGDKNTSVDKNYNKSIYSISSKYFYIDDEEYCDFIITTRQLSPNFQTGSIKTFSAIEANDAFLSHFPHFSDISFSSTTHAEIERMGQASSPVFIFGEAGTGKMQMAALIFQKCKYASHNLYLIECGQMTDKSWTAFFEGSDSPLAMENISVCLNNLDKLGDARLEMLRNFIIESSLTKRMKLIFCYETLPSVALPKTVRYFLDEIGALSKQILPLRERVGELMPLAHIYINSYDEVFCRDIIGLTPDAESVFLSYQWPGNLNQFKRVVSELVLSSPSCYVSEELVKKTLDKEKTYMTSAMALSSVIDINKPLNEIEKDIARAVLAKCNGNKSKAAEKLKISRTTLWRLLSD